MPFIECWTTELFNMYFPFKDPNADTRIVSPRINDFCIPKNTFRFSLSNDHISVHSSFQDIHCTLQNTSSRLMTFSWSYRCIACCRDPSKNIFGNPRASLVSILLGAAMYHEGEQMCPLEKLLIATNTTRLCHWLYSKASQLFVSMHIVYNLKGCHFAGCMSIAANIFNVR